MKTIFKPIVFLLSLLIITTCSKDPEPEQVSSPDTIQNPVDENSESDPIIEEILDLKVFDIYEESESIWDFWVVGKEGNNYYVNNKDNIPSNVYFKPAGEEAGFSVFFDSSGLPTELVYEEYVFYFDNFSGTNMDMAIINPDNSIQYIKNISSETDWDLYMSELSGKSVSNWRRATSVAIRAIACGVSLAELEPTSMLLACSSFLLSVSDLVDPGDDQIEIFGWNADELSALAAFIDCSSGQLLSCSLGLLDTAILESEGDTNTIETKSDKIEEAENQLVLPNSAPTIPSQPWPQNNAKIRGEIVNLTWTSIDPDADNLKFDLYFGNDSNPPMYRSNFSEKTITINSLQTGRTYYWKVRAKDIEGNTTFGPRWRFEIVNNNNDDDNDGVPNDEDECPNTPQGSIVDENGCVDPNASLDDDKDGVNNAYDECPDTPAGENVYSTGCSLSQLDNDNDGVPQSEDQCDDTPEGENVNANGCSETQLDEDSDGVPNNIDECPDTSAGEDVDAQGCALYQLDEDGDGVSDDIDICLNTPTGEDVNQNGCAQSQIDDDQDGISNDTDKCPDTDSGENVDNDGCAENQLDDDQDGVTNDLDLCPNTPPGINTDFNGCYDADKIIIPDDAFENHLETHNWDGATEQNISFALGDGIIGNNRILKQKVVNLKRILINNANILDLTGLEEFVELDTISLYTRNVKSLNLSNISGLLGLALGANSNFEGALESIQLDGNTNLRELYLGYNNLSNIDLSNNTGLEILDLEGNPLSNLDVSNNPILNSLNASNNPNLFCIQVTQSQLDNNTSSWIKDGSAIYSLDCNNISDSDADGVSDDLDQCPNTPNGETVNGQGCGQSQLDDDNDGVFNPNDQCPNTPSGETVNAVGCSNTQTDSDADGVSDDLDQCPNTPIGETVNGQGCGQSQLDDDNDGVFNANDQCPNTPLGDNVDSSGCSIPQTGNQTYVPDNNFEQALIDLGYDDVLDDFVLTSNINSLTTLDIMSKNISDLSGIEDFGNLYQLICSDNQISNLDVRQNVELRSLYAWGNQISSIDLSQNNQLLGLFIGTNPITSLDLSQNVLLTDLFISSTQLTSLDVSQNTQLKSLEVTDIQLSILNLSQNLQLENLYASVNNLTTLDLSQHTQLRQVDVSSNSLQNIDLSQSSELRSLTCHNNNLINLDISNNSKLESLNPHNNPLSSLDISQNNLLSYFYISGVPLTCVQVSQQQLDGNLLDNLQGGEITFSIDCN